MSLKKTPVFAPRLTKDILSFDLASAHTPIRNDYIDKQLLVVT